MPRFSVVASLAVLLFVTPAWAADFTVTALCCATWIVNGASNPPLSLVRGKTYTFDVNAADHTFYIKTAPVNGSGSTWDKGVTNNGVDVGTVSFTVPADAPATLYYQCGIHSAMTGTIQVTGSSGSSVPATNAYAVALLALVLGGAGFAAVRRRRASPNG